MLCFAAVMDFGFPYEAYSIQNDLMQSLYRCFEEGGVGIFESPTGTGKSLSIICATLSWLRDHELKKRAQLEQTVHKDKNDENKADDDDWIGAYRKKLDASKVVDEAAKQLATLDKVAARLKEARTKTSDSRHRKMKRKAPNNDSADRIADEVPPLSDDDPDKDIAPVDYNSDDDAAEKRAQSAKPEEEEKLSCTKIFYCSRTHSQLEQFAQEIQKTKFLPRAVTLGSRQALCVNDAVRRLGSVQLMNERCLEMKEKGASTNKVVVMTGDDDKKKVQRTRGGVCKCEYYRSEAMED
uniref:Helicase ATP-binding domain-containing protein n=1 Tax=Plectus sambesii TaxID=2011161 RepID=A0A914V0I9_9BILA